VLYLIGYNNVIIKVSDMNNEPDIKDKSDGRYRNVFLAIGLITGFIFIVTTITIYVSDAIKNHNACGCLIPIPYMILILSSLGIFVGSLAYYFIASGFRKEKQAINEGIEKTLSFLEPDERKVVKALIGKKDGLKQSELDDATGFNKVQIHRILKKLEMKGIIMKESKGSRINTIKLNEGLRDVFG